MTVLVLAFWLAVRPGWSYTLQENKPSEKERFANRASTGARLMIQDFSNAIGIMSNGEHRRALMKQCAIPHTLTGIKSARKCPV